MYGKCKAHVPGQLDKSAMAEHKFKMGHIIKFDNSIMQDKVQGYVDHLIKRPLRSGPISIWTGVSNSVGPGTHQLIP
jgi:hypothetical protein